MDNLFLLLFIIALVGLIWGVVAPKSLANHSKKNLTRKHFSLGFGTLAILFFILTAVTAPKQPKSQTIRLTTTNTQSTSKPSIQTKTITQIKTVPFTSSTVNDASLAQGTTEVSIKGVNGVETFTYKDTYTNGKQTAQKLISDVVTTPPINQVTSVGTYVASTPATTSPTPAPSTTSCYPTTDEGGCYEPGEYCRTSDEGTTGVAGDGKSITCEDNNGWRWEP